MRGLLVGLIVISFIISAQAAVVNSNSGEICSNALKSEQPAFQVGLDNLFSLKYIRQALQGVAVDADYCVSSVVLGKNIYQYNSYLIKIRILNHLPQVLNKYTFFFLFQDASVQAFQNVGGQPWDGLDLKQTSQFLSDLENNQTFSLSAESNQNFDILSLVKQSNTYKNNLSKIDLDSLSVLPILTEQNKSTYLATWHTLPGNNPFIMQTVTQGVLIKVTSTTDAQSQQTTLQALIAENLFVGSDLQIGLQNQLENNRPANNDRTQWSDYLMQISTF